MVLDKRYKNKKAQEEIVGFALIIIIVAVIFLIVLSISLMKPKKSTIIESYKAESFIQTMLQYTTDCAGGYKPNYYNLRGLITACKMNYQCVDERDTCDVLKSDIENILKSSWMPEAEADGPIKGYKLNVFAEKEDQEIQNIIEPIKYGNETSTYKGTEEIISTGAEKVKLILVVYG